MIGRRLLALMLALLSAQLCAAPANPLQRLMELTERRQDADAAARLERLAEFKSARDTVHAKVLALREQVRQARADNDRLQASFEEQRIEIGHLEQQIADRSGDLATVFAAARQRAGELAGHFRASLTSAEKPERVAAMGRLAADGRRPPRIDELRSLWRAMQLEILAASQSVRFLAPVVNSDGESESVEVTRLGPFTAVSEGRYLHYDAEIGVLAELRRQPPVRLRQLAAAYQQATTGPLTMVIDPTRGKLLSLTTQRPELVERVHQGGRVGYLILGLGLVGALLGVWRWLALGITARRVRRQLAQLTEPEPDNPLGRVLASYTHKTDDIDGMAMQLEEAILRETPLLTRGEALLKLLAGVAPLLGLLGTVTGMIATFQSISLFGAGDPRLMADGISQALVTTALGLIVAIPLLLAHLAVSARSSRLVSVLEEQSAGLIARQQGWRG